MVAFVRASRIRIALAAAGIVFASLLTGLLIPSLACAITPGYGALSGTVVSRGRPLTNALVDYDWDDGRTDAEGRYTLTDVTPGTYSLRVTHVGYWPATVTVVVSEGATTTADFSLVQGAGIAIQDPQIDAAARVELGIPSGPITDADMLYVNDITVGSGVSSLEGLQYATNLSNLRIGPGTVSDLSPIANSTNLRWLIAQGNSIESVAPLSNMTGLIGVYLSSNRITDLWPISGLGSLEILNLNDNQVDDISPLRGCTRLSQLGLERNRLTNIDGIQWWRGLQSLYVRGNEIRSLPWPYEKFVLGLLSVEENYLDLSPGSPASNLTQIARLESFGTHVYYGNQRVAPPVLAKPPVVTTYSTTTKLTGPRTVIKRRALRLSGTVSNGARGQVTISMTRKVGRKWKSAGHAHVNVVGGRYAYSPKPKYKGYWRFIASYSGGVSGVTTFKPSKSGTKSVKVK
jgi:hypothetical protein